jgi:hypothetical protein
MREMHAVIIRNLVSGWEVEQPPAGGRAAGGRVFITSKTAGDRHAPDSTGVNNSGVLTLAGDGNLPHRVVPSRR